MILSQQDALAAVAASNHRSPADYKAWKAPEDSIHAGVWYVSELNVMDMPIDDCVWFVLPDGRVGSCDSGRQSDSRAKRA